MEETIARPSDDETQGKGNACTLLSFATLTNVSALFTCVIPTRDALVPKPGICLPKKTRNIRKFSITLERKVFDICDYNDIFYSFMI